MPSRNRARVSLMKGLVALLLAATTVAASAQQRYPTASRRAIERTVFTDAEITDGFLKIAFGAELDLAHSGNRIRKFDGPVRVGIESRAEPDRRAQAAAVVDDIRKRVQQLDIAMADGLAAANVVVKLVRDRDLTRVIGQLYGRERARQIQRSLAPKRSESSIPTSSSSPMPEISSSTIAYTKSYCRRSVRSTTPIRYLGPCSMTTCRWASSASTTNTFSISFMIRAFDPE
jgi:hypothetical protein